MSISESIIPSIACILYYFANIRIGNNIIISQIVKWNLSITQY